MNQFTNSILRGFQLHLVRIYEITRVDGETVKLRSTFRCVLDERPSLPGPRCEPAWSLAGNGMI
jgi:hypothetical protein